MPDTLPRIYLIRHGETAWSISGQHTGGTDIELTEQGERNARMIGTRLKSLVFEAVYTSSLQRATKTCELAGLGGQAIVEQDLVEWDYGEYEGVRTSDIRKARPNWNIFQDGCPGGESPAQISKRADRIVIQIKSHGGNVALFAHGHFLRVLTARWIGLPVAGAQRFLLNTASISILGFEHNNREEPVIAGWNECVQG
ncbi:MAG: histidine phosphatase family protein [Planctomycetes bacterium]|nr:histidine phosphatase family protein [Planctomycetota bacterium]